MGARAIASAYVTFGLVNIPIKLYSTGQGGPAISFNLLHRGCGSRLKQQYLCVREGRPVGRDEMAKGYEVAKDQYVVFSDEELKALEEERSKAIEITEFVPEAEVDPLYYEGAYYLGPDKGAERAFRLLGEALRRTGLAAIARYAARGKQSLVLLRPMKDGLVMQQLRYADEVRPISEVPVPAAEVKGPELELAIQFIEQLRAEGFEPGKYEDTYRQRLEEVIRHKAEGQELTLAPSQEPVAQVIDLMTALKASLAKSAVTAPAPGGPVPEAPGEGAAARRPPRRAASHAPGGGKKGKQKASK